MLRAAKVTRVLVTGGGGFLGSHLARRLRSAGDDVRVLDSVAVPSWVDAANAEYLRADIRDAAAVATAVQGMDVVVHAAFASPAVPAGAMRDINVGATAELCRAARAAGVGRLVVISSTIVERTHRSPGVLRRSPLSRLNAYRETRRAAEEAAGVFRAGGGELALVRPKTFMGAERVGAFSLIFDLIFRGQPVPLPGSGRNHYQLLDVDDLTAGLELLIRRGGDGIFAFGASSYGTVAEDMQALIDHAGTRSELRTLPGRLTRPALRAAELAGLTPLSEWYQFAASGQDSVSDTSRARSELGWRPKRSNRELMAVAFDWYASRTAAGEAAPATHPPPAGHRALLRALNALLR